MTDTNSVARSLHDVGLAAWFGGSLMGAVGLNGAAANIADPSQRTRVAADGWARWAPLSAAAIGAHLLGGALIVRANKARIAGQSGVGGATVLKAVLTAAALAATAGSGYYGQQVAKAGEAHSEGVTEPSSMTPPEVASAQRVLRPLQWAIPALTGAVLVVSSRMGEQQRPAEALSGILGRVSS